MSKSGQNHREFQVMVKLNLATKLILKELSNYVVDVSILSPEEPGFAEEMAEFNHLHMAATNKLFDDPQSGFLFLKVIDEKGDLLHRIGQLSLKLKDSLDEILFSSVPMSRFKKPEFETRMLVAPNVNLSELKTTIEQEIVKGNNMRRAL